MDFPQEIPAHQEVLRLRTDFIPSVQRVESENYIILSEIKKSITLKSAVLRVCGSNEVEGHMGRPTDVLMRKAAARALVAPAHHTLADKVGPTDHKDE